MPGDTEKPGPLWSRGRQDKFSAKWSRDRQREISSATATSTRGQQETSSATATSDFIQAVAFIGIAIGSITAFFGIIAVSQGGSGDGVYLIISGMSALFSSIILMGLVQLLVDVRIIRKAAVRTEAEIERVSKKSRSK